MLAPASAITGEVLSTEVTVTSTLDEFVPSVALTVNVKLVVETSLSAFAVFISPSLELIVKRLSESPAVILYVIDLKLSDTSASVASMSTTDAPTLELLSIEAV